VADDAGDLAIEARELLACSTFHQGDFARSLELARTVIAEHQEQSFSALMARMAEHPTSACNSWGSLSAWFLGQADESMAMAERAIEIGEDHLYALSTALVQRAFLHQLRNEPDECRHWAAQSIALADDQGFPMRAMQARMLLGWAEAVTGSPAEGADLIAATLEEFRSLRVRLTEPFFLALEAEARLLAGDLDRASRLIDEARANMRETTRTFFHESELDRLEARVHLAQGDAHAVGAAREALDRSEALAAKLASPPLMLRSAVERLRLEREHGDPTSWECRVAELLPVPEGNSETPDTRAARGLLAATSR
jgi:predicted ATPase